MKRHVFIRSATLVVLMALEVSLSFAQSPPGQENQGAIDAGTTPAATPPWFIDTIDGDTTNPTSATMA